MQRIAIGLVLLLSGCAITERADAVLALDANLAAGEALYDADCGSCHGVDGRGADLGPDLVHELHHGDALILTFIVDGVGEEMPAFGHYSDQELADLLGYLHELADQ